MKKLVLLVPLFFSTLAAEPPRTPLFADDFNRAEVGGAWQVVWKDFTIADGTLRGSQTVPGHGAVARTKSAMRDGGVEFRFQFAEGTTVNAVWNDRDYKESHGGHLCRVVLTPKQIRLGDDKEGLRHEIVEMKKDPKRKAEVEKLTAGRTLAIPFQLEAGRWYTVRAEISGDTLRAFVDGREVGSLKSSGIAHPTKKDFHFTVTGKEARFDDFRAWSTD